MVDQIIRELSVHAAIEEAYFYPEVRKALGEGGELVDESLHEHQEVKETLAALEDMDPAEAAYDQKVASLIADVRHHVEEEEGEMFPKLRTALSAEQLHDIGQKLADGKAKAPTHPHPAAPASGPGAKVAGPAAGMVDGVRDKLSDPPPTQTPSAIGSVGSRGPRSAGRPVRPRLPQQACGLRPTRSGARWSRSRLRLPRPARSRPLGGRSDPCAWPTWVAGGPGRCYPTDKTGARWPPPPLLSAPTAFQLGADRQPGHPAPGAGAPPRRRG